MIEQEAYELDLLRQFFKLWVEFHQIQRGHRQDQELAAQRMVDCANTIKSFHAGPETRQ